jgi:hypothetical protein
LTPRTRWALLTLLALRARGRVRAGVRRLGTVRGVLTALSILALLALALGPSLFLLTLDRAPPAWGSPAVEAWIPLLFFGLWLLGAVTSAGEAALYFAPSEIDFLFPAPFSRREILAYKILGTAPGALLFATLSFAPVALVLDSPAATWLGFALGLTFVAGLNLCSQLVAEIASVRIRDLVRTWLLFGAAILAGIGLWQALGTTDKSWWTLLREFPRTPAGAILLAPFSVFAYVMTAGGAAERAAWAAVGGALIAATWGVALVLDANYTEAAVRVSRRVASRLRRMASGTAVGTLPARALRRSGYLALPWWRGAGPLASLQLVQLRRAGKNLVWIAAGTALLTSALFSTSAGRGGSGGPILTALAYMTFLATTHVPMAFRGDSRHLEILKALPIKPGPLVVGQLAVAVAIVWAFQWACLGIMAIAFPADRAALVIGGLFALPFDFALFAIENYLLLAFPTSYPPGGAPGPSHTGRLFLTSALKGFSLAAIAGVCGGVGFGIWFFLAPLWVALAASWAAAALACAVCGWMVARAFARLDVTADVVD